MEQPAVDDCVEPLPQFNEAEGISDQEANLNTSIGCFGFRQFDGCGGEINPNGFVSQSRRQESMFTRPAAHVEDSARQAAGPSEPDECGLGTANIPRWRH